MLRLLLFLLIAPLAFAAPRDPIIQSVAGGGIGGAVLTAIVGMLKKALVK